MQQARPEKEPKPKLGAALQHALQAQGKEISLEEAERLARALLSLAEQGLLVPLDKLD